MNHFFTFSVNNQGTLSLYQSEHDGPVRIVSSNQQGQGSDTISAGDMVMLINWYRYVKQHDIQDDFINPNGKNKA